MAALFFAKKEADQVASFSVEQLVIIMQSLR